MRRPALLVAFTLLLALAGAATVAASPAPVSACSACGDSFERAAASVGEQVTVRHSAATVRVHANGSATWTVRNRLPREDARMLRANDSLRPALETALARGVGYTGEEPPTLLSASVDGGNVTASYRVDGVARQSAGTLLYTGLRNDPGARVYVDLGANRVRIIAPDGYHVGYAPSVASVEGETVTLTRLPDAGTDRFLAFSEHEVVAGAHGHTAVGLAVLPTVGRNVLLMVALPSLAFAGVAAGLPPLLRRVPNLNHRHVAAGVGALATYVAAHPVLPVPMTSGFEPLAFATGVGGLLLAGAAVVPPVRGRLDTPMAFAFMLGAFIAAALLTHFMRPQPGPSNPYQLGQTVVRVAPAMLVLLGFPIGAAAGRDRWRRGLAGTLAVVVATLSVAAPVAHRGGSLFILSVLAVTFGGLLGPVAGAPLALLGVTTVRAGRP